MRHRINHKMLSVTSSHRSAMLANIACALINHEIITTTLVKAKVVRRYFDKLMTIAKKYNKVTFITKKHDLPSMRRLNAEIKSHECVNKLLHDLALRSGERLGGYTRIVRKGFRRGDATAMAYLELSDRKIVVNK